MLLALYLQRPSQPFLSGVDERATLRLDTGERRDVDVDLFFRKGMHIVLDSCDGTAPDARDAGGHAEEPIAVVVWRTKALDALEGDGGGGEVADGQMFGHHRVVAMSTLHWMYSVVS